MYLPKRKGWTVPVAIVLALASAAPSRAADELDCYSEDLEKRIAACTGIIERRAASDTALSAAFASRALAFSQKRQYDRAIADYDRALAITPNAPSALNNRAWAYFKWGRPAMGRDDVEKSLRLDPRSGPAYDTRAHIAQALGDPASALADYNLAMDVGGEHMTLLYQCGLADQGLYRGPRDGQPNAELRAAMSICVENPRCDPLPADEFCRPAAS